MSSFDVGIRIGDVEQRPSSLVIESGSMEQAAPKYPVRSLSLACR